MTIADGPEHGREGFQHQTWADEYASLSAADRAAPLHAEDLERLATAAYLTGRDAESEELWARAYREFLDRGEILRAIRCAFWLGMSLRFRGETARGSGWIARAKQQIESVDQESPEHGYVLLPEALRALSAGDPAAAHATSSEAAKIGDRFGEADLRALAQLGQGQALIRLGQVSDGTALLDQVMVAVTAGEVSPMAAGIIYCAVLEICQQIFDHRRAQEWTAAMSRWCAAHPDLVPFRGQCFMRRAEILRLHGAWQDAINEARRASDWLRPPDPAVGAACYQRGELHRLRGEFAEAEEAYRQGSRWGRRPEPGLPLLRLAQGQVDPAAAAIRRVVNETPDRLPRSRLLAPYVEIMLAAGDIEAARTAADELSSIAADLDIPLLHASAAEATGAVHLAEGDTPTALAALRRAWMAWQELEAPYEAARVRVLVGLACRQLGDEDCAEMELDAARWVFQHLGAGPDLARVETLSRPAAAKAPAGLTAREVEVLRLIAEGKSNKEIASALIISEHTVARHVQNIFAKLDVASRTAAAAFAFEHHLASPRSQF